MQHKKATELELKFRVDDTALFDTLERLTTLGAFTLTPAPAPEHQQNVYFDTADGRLRKNRHGLRIRDLGQRRVATLKGPSQSTGGIYERAEWEAEIGDDDRPEMWPSGELRDRALEQTGGEPLQPTVRVRTLRRLIYASRGGAPLIELALDEGVVAAGGREEPFRELEAELLDNGTRADLDELVALLRQQFQLEPEERTKLARGLALLDHKSE